MPCFVCFDGESNGHFNLFCTYLGKFFYVKSLVACCWPAHTLCLGSFDLRGQLFGVLHQFAQLECHRSYIPGIHQTAYSSVIPNIFCRPSCPVSPFVCHKNQMVSWICPKKNENRRQDSTHL